MSNASAVSLHLGADDLPWAKIAEGFFLKVVYTSPRQGLWITHTRFGPGFSTQTHRHTGPVYQYTVSGAWGYREHDFIVRAGSFLYEPAGSVHTQYVPDDSTEMAETWTQVYGANLNLDAEGKIEFVVDAVSMLAFYLKHCEKQGLPRPNVLTD